MDRKFMRRWGRGYAIRAGKWKLVWQRDKKRYQSLLRAQAKEPAKTDRPSPNRGLFLPPELFDIEADPAETKDLASQYPEIVERLKQELEGFDAIAAPYTEREKSLMPTY
jgi:hypothetical protein